MPKEYSRIQRIAELIQHELAQMLLRQVEDPHLKDLTISKVEVTKDLAFAKIYVTVFDEEQDINDKLRRLNKASNYLRYLLANSIELRVTPQLKFIYDPSVSNSNRLMSLLSSAPKPQQDEDDSD